MHLCNWWSQKLQIWCRGKMWKSQPTDDQPTVPVKGVVRSFDAWKILWAPIISLERLNRKSSNFVHKKAISILATGWYITNKSACLWSCDQGPIQGVFRVSGHPPLWYGALFKKNIFSKRAPIRPILGFWRSIIPQNGRFHAQNAHEPSCKIWRR